MTWNREKANLWGDTEQAETESSQHAPQPARSIRVTEIFGNEEYDSDKHPQLGSTKFLERLPAEMLKLRVASVDLENIFNKVPRKERNPEHQSNYVNYSPITVQC